MAVAVFDTNILIDFLKGYQPAIAEFAYWDDVAISAITWIEIMAGARDDDQADIVEFLATFNVIQTNTLIMDLAARLRRTSIGMNKKVLLPDAVIMATGLIYGDMTITRNKKDFGLADQLTPGHIRIPYELIGTTPVSFANILPPPAPPFPKSMI